MQCTYFGDIGAPPPCENGELEATVVDGFLLAACEGGWFRSDLDTIARGIASSELELYLVTGPKWRGWHDVLYLDHSQDVAVAYLVSEDGIVGSVGLSCGTPEDWAARSHIILRGPAWPEDDAP